jgi:HAD superfamily hydrolase (TIGR01549 family)
VSFDLDGTLIRGPFARVLRELEAEVEPTPGRPGVRDEVFARHEELLHTDSVAAYDWEQLVRENLSGRGRRMPFELLERLEQILAEHPATLLHERTREHLERLTCAGWRVALLTNGWRRYQVPALRSAGILDVFDVIVASDDVGVAKPEPPIFARVRAGAEVHVHVGDRVDHDVLGGTQSGARTVLLRRDAAAADGTSAEEPTPTVDAYLRSLARAEGVPEDVPTDQLRPDIVRTSLSDLVDSLVR